MKNEIKELVSTLWKYREDYYNGVSEIPDEEFDFYERRLKALDPENPYFDKVGAKVVGGDEIKHKIPMLSMQKVQTAEDAEKWYTNMRFDGVWIEPKLDGISGKIVYDTQGRFEYATTRGDGKIGAIIGFGKEIEGVPKKFLPNSELRGEFVIFKKYRKFFDGPLRNACSGIMKRKEYSDDLKYVTFVIYDAHTYDSPFTFANRGDKIHRIATILDRNDQKYHIVPVERTSNITETYNRYVSVLRNKWPYETDGLIMTIDGDQNEYDSINSRYKITSFNRYNMALKPPAEYAESTIIDIEATVNRRKVSFVAILEPIQLLDVTISRATLDNYNRLVKNGVGIGTTVLVKRANDVIPKVFDFYNKPSENIKRYKLKNCPVCGSKLEPIYQDLVCTNEFHCRGIYKSKIEQMVKVFEGKNIGDAAISFISERLADIAGDKPLLLSTFVQNMLVVNGSYPFEPHINEFYNGGKRPQIFKDALEDLFNDISEVDVIASMNIPYIGKNSLLDHGVNSYDAFINYVKRLEETSVIEDSFDSTVYTWSRKEINMQDLKDCIELLRHRGLSIDSDPGTDAITYCVSGSVPGFESRKGFVDYIKSITSEYKFSKDVSSALNYLVTTETTTAKVMKAKKFNIPIVTPEEFLKIVK